METRSPCAKPAAKIYETFGCDNAGVEYGLHGMAISYGAEMSDDHYNPPAIARHPLTLDQLDQLDPERLDIHHDKALGICYEAAQRIMDKLGDEVGCGMELTGPLTCASGLVGTEVLPTALADRIEYVGNTSLAGAVACLLSCSMREKSLHAAKNVHYLELSAYPGYEKDLVRAMRFLPSPLPRFVCIGDHRVRRTEGGDDGSDWHFSAETLAAEARGQGAAGWRILPFYTTLIAESLGAKPTLTAEGAHLSQTPYQRAEQMPKEPDFSLPRIRAMEGAMALLKGEDLIYQLDGPLTVLGQLIPMGKLFVSLRKSDELLRLAEDWVCTWADWAAARGARVLSFADPIATLDLLGEKTFGGSYLPSLRRLLDRLRSAHPELVLYVCGKMTQSLLDMQAVTPRIRRYDAANYGEALRDFCNAPEDAMVGQFCAHLLSSPETALTLFVWNKAR